MKLHQLKIFIAIAESGSFSQGAETVSLNQSTVSQHIAALEEEVGTALFDRTGQGALLTSGGQLFLRHARRVLAEQNALVDAMGQFRGLEKASLVIGASNIPANYLLPPLLPALADRYPGISFTMLTGDSREMLDRLAGHEIELALVGSRFEAQDIHFTALAKDRLMLVIGRTHPLARRQQISVEELMNTRLVVREVGSGSGRTLEDALEKAGFAASRLQVAARLGSNEAVLQAVAAGFHGAFISELAVQSHLKQGNLVRVDVPELQVHRQIWLARLQTRSLSPAAQAVTDLLLEYMESPP